MLCPITDRTQHYGVPLLRASLQQNGASAEQWLLPLFNARTGYLFFTVFSKATPLAVTAVPGGEYQFWIAKIGIHQSKFFCRQLLAYGAAQSSLHSQLYLSRLAKRQTAGYADHTCANVLHCAHFEQWAKYLANPTDSVEKIPQQVSPSCNEVGNSSSKHVGRVGNRLWRSALSKKLFGSRKTTTSRDWQWFLLGNQACSSICGVQQHRLL